MSCHQEKLGELKAHCEALVKLVDEYFQPPNLMAWKGECDWEVFIRRKGSDVQFAADDWSSD